MLLQGSVLVSDTSLRNVKVSVGLAQRERAGCRVFWDKVWPYGPHDFNLGQPRRELMESHQVPSKEGNSQEGEVQGRGLEYECEPGSCL